MIAQNNGLGLNISEQFAGDYYQTQHFKEVKSDIHE